MPIEDNLEDQGQEAEDQETQEQEIEQDESDFDKARALETIRKQRESEKELAKKLKAVNAELKKLQDVEAKRKEAELSELEKSQKRAQELEERLQAAQTTAQALRLRQEFGKVAARLKLSFVDQQAEDDAFELADMDDVELYEDGKITGLEDAVKALQKKRPYLFTSDEGGSRGTPKRPVIKGGTPPGSEAIRPKIKL